MGSRRQGFFALPPMPIAWASGAIVFSGTVAANNGTTALGTIVFGGTLGAPVITGGVITTAAAGTIIFGGTGAGSITAAIHAARARHPALPLIVEVETLAQLEEALREGCTRILIDDFDAGTRREAVRIACSAPFNGAIPLEVSGGVDLAGLRAIAEDGVDCISTGALTKHVRAIDLSMKLGRVPPRLTSHAPN